MHVNHLVRILILAGAAAAIPSGIAEKQWSNHSRGEIDTDLPPVVPINTRAEDQDLISKLLTSATQTDRIRLLDQPGDFVFDFSPSGSAPADARTVGKGGLTVAATSKTFPALIGNGAAMTVGFLGPCGINTPHVHNRATELNFIAEGRLVTNFIEENGARAVANTLTKNQMAIFPQGAIHTEFNPDCTDAVFVAGFNNQDPGVQTIAQNFFSLRPDIVKATLGKGVQYWDGADIETFREGIPANVALGIEACLKKCGIRPNAKRDVNELFVTV